MMRPLGLRFLLVRVGELRCALEVREVVEILPALVATRLPGAPDAVRGVANVRGQIVPIFDARRYLAQPDTNAGYAVILVQYRGNGVGIAVDEVADLVTLDDPPTDSADLPGVDRSVARAVGRDPQGMFIVLNTDQMIGPIMPSEEAA